MDFSSDNVVGASREIIAAIADTNDGSAAPYGNDPHSKRAARMLQDVFECECPVFLLTSGTASNALALSTLAQPWQAIFCHDDAHVIGEETGAPEFFSGGAKLIGIEGDAGKVSPAALLDAMDQHPRGITRKTPPAALSLSQATECGTIYTPGEIAELSAIAHAAGLKVHMDGARFANALVKLGCSPAEMTWKAGIDCLSFGATKNGALACEALLFFDPVAAEDFEHRRKRGGQTLSKGRFLGAQMTAYLEEDHWLGWARHANAMAMDLGDALTNTPGARVIWAVEANEVFAVLPADVHNALRAAGFHYGVRADRSSRAALSCGEDDVFVRLVTSFATDPADISHFRSIAQNAK